MSRMIPIGGISYIAGTSLANGQIFNGVALIVCVLALVGFEIRDDNRSSKETTHDPL